MMAKMLVVRRGMSPAFHFFCRVLAEQHECVVVEDRRVSARPYHNDRRRADPRATYCRDFRDFWMIGGSSSDLPLKSSSEKSDTLPQWRSISQILR